MSINPVVILMKVYLWCWHKATNTPDWVVNRIIMPLIMIVVLVGLVGLVGFFI